MTKEELKQYIDENVYENPDGDITGDDLNEVLKKIVDNQGTAVVANPDGEVTETLTKIKIEHTVYSAPQGPQGEPGAQGPQGEPGAQGPQGVPGRDAVNPFKGWYDDASVLPANPVVGDYAYVKGVTSSDPTAIYECNTDGVWTDSGRTADESNVQTFASGEEVNETYIDDTHLTDPIPGSLALAEDALGHNDIANDFNGGTGKVLSAEKGKELYEEFYTPEEYITVSPTSMKNFIQSTNTWTSDSYYRGAYIAVNPGDRFVLTTDANNGYNALYAFLVSLRSGTATKVEYASGYTARKTLAPNKSITITAPSDANYLYLHRVQRANSQSVIILPTVQKITTSENKFDVINKEFEEVKNNIDVIRATIGKLSLTIPDGFKSIETVNKCQNTSYIPLHRLEATGNNQYFDEGEVYTGLPYYSTQNRNDSLFQFTLETIFSLWNNPDSILYTYPDVHSGAAYTGAVCSSVACWFTSYPLWIPTQDIVTMLDRKTINDISDVEIGDVLVCHDTIRTGDMDHAMVVCDILFDHNGITNIVIFEAWYVGTMASRTYTFTPQGFMNLLNGTGRGSDLYIIGRLGKKIRTVQPLVVNTDIISERGDNTYYEQGEDVFVQSSQNSFTAVSPSGSSTTVDFSEKPLKENTSMRNIGDVLNTEIGKWTLNGANGEKSHLTIIKKGSAVLSTDGKDNNKCTVTLSGYEGCKPCAYAVIGIRNSYGSYPSPVSNKTAGRMTAFSKANPRAWGVITPTDNETTFNIDLTGHGNVYIGYYIRVFYDTGCGQAWQNTWDGVIDSGVGYIMF